MKSPDPGFKLCDICEPPGSGKTRFYGVKTICSACEGVGQIPYEEKEPEPRRRKRATRRGHPQTSRTESQGRFWSEGETKILEEHYETASMDELKAKLPARKWESIRKKAVRMGLDRGHLRGEGRRRAARK